jgi:hypothetical protein
MASVHRDPRGRSPFWYCAFYGADGGRKFKSTKERVRKEALKICFKWEQLAEMAHRKELTAAQGRKVISEMVKISSGEAMNFHSVEGWLNEWLANKAGAVADGTLLRYRQVIRDFLAHLGPTQPKPRWSRYRPTTLSVFATSCGKKAVPRGHATWSLRKC